MAAFDAAKIEKVVDEGSQAVAFLQHHPQILLALLGRDLAGRQHRWLHRAAGDPRGHVRAAQGVSGGDAAGRPPPDCPHQRLSRSSPHRRRPSHDALRAGGASSAGLGKGSRFYFTVPTVREQAHRGDVLVVEDDSGFAHLLEAELTARGLSSIWAADAETAEHLMTKQGARAVVLDLLLPGLQGDEFLQRLRNRHGSAIPVVVVTLKDLTLEENLALQQAGVTAVLRKGPRMAATAANLIAKSIALEAVEC